MEGHDSHILFLNIFSKQRLYALKEPCLSLLSDEPVNFNTLGKYSTVISYVILFYVEPDIFPWETEANCSFRSLARFNTFFLAGYQSRVF